MSLGENEQQQVDDDLAPFASKDPNMVKLLFAMVCCAVVSVQSTEYGGDSFHQGGYGGYNSPRGDYGEGYDGGYDSVPYGGYPGGNKYQGGYEKQGYGHGGGYSGYGNDGGYSGYGYGGGPSYGSRFKAYP
ncbi:hypothetical protein AC1031_014819 [Aphanomyces cochlioides]|nr:hypothetical protein AC1031_014800 [Aphanomyces cochlioides]KAG9398201.1 hypothetical protein AC1031_014802 [Aphanomyces cochlioides]KAG9398204.1 hypothetical protein AC1031_014805 [Aphanomyces cochlioides]KAG9398206.1 hypothetical protein AC1031_014807 [Aphanomyces cochlioides]KAG9398208.1 hypothetical protein AC1031_014809 [Aphanomyces cochlioides]